MIEVYKKKYQTCLQALEELRAFRPELKEEVLSYNGILDPMAEGVLPVLVGESENKNRNDFTGSKKTYEVGVLVGISTDSSDLLGIVKEFRNPDNNSNLIVEHFLSHEQKFNQTVPMHSNRKVDGKRLWWWMLNGVEIPAERRPANNVEILASNFISEQTVPKDYLTQEIDNMERNIGERFRLDKVVASWREFLSRTRQDEFTLLTFELTVTSGFYVRTFVDDIGKRLGIPLLVFSLKRTRVFHQSGN